MTKEEKIYEIIDGLVKLGVIELTDETPEESEIIDLNGNVSKEDILHNFLIR